MFKGKIGPLLCSQKNYLHILIWQRTAHFSGPFWLFHSPWNMQAKLAELSNISYILIITRAVLALLFPNGYIYYKPSQPSTAGRSLSNCYICAPYQEFQNQSPAGIDQLRRHPKLECGSLPPEKGPQAPRGGEGRLRAKPSAPKKASRPPQD